jgi:predicted tellurium resistance membrane protein TerC
MLEFFYRPDTWLSLTTLSLLEIMLGVDNLVFIALATEKLPASLQRAAWRFGLGFACLSRLLLLSMVNWLARFTEPCISIAQFHFSARDLAFLVGGLFLVVKATRELLQPRHTLTVTFSQGTPIQQPLEDWVRGVKKSYLPLIILQIVLLDILFSLDSVMAAVVMTQNFVVMAMSILIATGFMLAASGLLNSLIQKHPRLKILAISFVLLVGFILILDGLGIPISRSYLYSIMGFSIFLEGMQSLSARRVK